VSISSVFVTRWKYRLLVPWSCFWKSHIGPSCAFLRFLGAIAVLIPTLGCLSW
jgi:hypothetical protein